MFLDTLDLARGRDPASSAATPDPSHPHKRAYGAAIPALGLSNKAVYEDGDSMGGTNAGVSSGMTGGDYHEGPDLAPSAAPSVRGGFG